MGRSRGITAAVMGFLVRCSLEVKAESNNCCITGLLPRVVKLLDPLTRGVQVLSPLKVLDLP